MSAAFAIGAGPGFEPVVALLSAVGLPTEDLRASHCEHFFFLGPRSAPTGLVGLEIHGDVALLRSLVVSPQLRGCGAGSALVAHAEQHARKRGVRALYLLTTTAESFFVKRGYAAATRASAPPTIRDTREFADICPASSAFLAKPL